MGELQQGEACVIIITSIIKTRLDMFKLKLLDLNKKRNNMWFLLDHSNVKQHEFWAEHSSVVWITNRTSSQ